MGRVWYAGLSPVARELDGNLNNLFALVGHSPATPGEIHLLFQALAVATFLQGTLISPAAFIVGAIGTTGTFLRSRVRWCDLKSIPFRGKILGEVKLQTKPAPCRA